MHSTRVAVLELLAILGLGAQAPPPPAPGSPDQQHWLYFGCEGDHPKSFSFMGGGLMPGRTEPIIGYSVEVDGQEHKPDETAPNRRTKILWSLAEGYLPSPVSEWDAGSVKVRIQHVAARSADDAATIVFSRVTLAASAATKAVLHVTAGPDRHVPLGGGPPYEVSLEAGKPVNLDFASVANGTRTVEQLKSAGGFDVNYAKAAGYFRKRIEGLAHPVTLPNPEWVNLYKALSCTIRYSIVKPPNGDAEVRCSGGPPLKKYFSYDHPVSSSVVEQMVMEGDFELSKPILSAISSQKFDKEPGTSVSKRIVPLATYLQLSGDKAFFTAAVRDQLKANARRLHELRCGQMDPKLKETGLYGIVDKSCSLDNGNDHLLVDNFAAIHGLVAYECVARELGDKAEADWAQAETKDLTECLNAALDATMKRRKVDYYNAALEDANRQLLRWPGNWLSTTLMGPMFPWGAWLKGFDLEGTWKEHFDASLAQDMEHGRRTGAPAHSWGGWWGCPYGAVYNAGQGLGCLYSDRYRTEIVANVDWLLANQSAPYRWGESFFQPRPSGDWTRPNADYSVWGLSLTLQAMLQTCISVKADGTVILGRAVPAEWLKAGSVIEWANVPVGRGKKMGFKIESDGENVKLQLSGDAPQGRVLLDLPGLEKAATVSAGSRTLRVKWRPAQ